MATGQTLSRELPDGRILKMVRHGGLYRWVATVDGKVICWGSETADITEQRVLGYLGLKKA